MPGRMYVVVNRFESGQPMLFRAATMPDAPIRKFASDAAADELGWRNGERNADA